MKKTIVVFGILMLLTNFCFAENFLAERRCEIKNIRSTITYADYKELQNNPSSQDGIRYSNAQNVADALRLYFAGTNKTLSRLVLYEDVYVIMSSRDIYYALFEGDNGLEEYCLEYPRNTEDMPFDNKIWIHDSSTKIFGSMKTYVFENPHTSGYEIELDHLQDDVLYIYNAYRNKTDSSN